MNLSKIYSFLIFGFIIACIVLFTLWRMNVNELKVVKKDLVDSQNALTILQKDNNKLIEYNKLKDKQLKEVEKKYKDRIDNIPSDKCGDILPSKELLEYFRKKAE